LVGGDLVGGDLVGGDLVSGVLASGDLVPIAETEDTDTEDTGKVGPDPTYTYKLTGVTKNQTIEVDYALDEDHNWVPDEYQATVNYKVLNGTWADGTTVDKTESVVARTWHDATGKWTRDMLGSYYPNNVPTGMLPADGYSASGKWIPSDPGTTKLRTDGNVTYVYSFPSATETTTDGCTVYVFVDGGTATADGLEMVEESNGKAYGSITVQRNGSATISFAPKSGYTAGYLYNNGTELYSFENPYTVEGILTDLVIERVYETPSTDSSLTEYTVTYEYENGTRSTVVDAGETVTVNAAPTKDGYTFQGWKSGTKTYQPGATIKVTSNMTFTPVWRDASSEILEGNGGGSEISENGDHSWNDGEVTKAATCTENGVKTYTCTVCEETKTEEIAATGHTWNDGEETKAATCTENGVKTYTCTACGETKTEEIPATGIHSWDDGTVTKAATTSETGVKTYTCTVCGETKTEEIPKLETEPITFTDVPEGQYYAQPVAWAVAAGVTQGTSDTTFSPDDSCTRAQVVTFLWRAAGEPEPTTTENPFTDVKEGAYYYKAVLWAVEKGITDGMSDTTFEPDGTCTRGQVVTFLYRYAGEPEVSTADSPFTDVKAGAYYEKAVAWAVSKKVTDGVEDTIFAPDSTCTRGQVVTFLYRAVVGV
jgi:hypothetical protein